MDKKQRVAEYVRGKREGMNLSQAALAHYLSLGLPRKIRKTHVSKWETGQSLPSVWMVAAIKATAEHTHKLPTNWVKEFAEGLLNLLMEKQNESIRDRVQAPEHRNI